MLWASHPWNSFDRDHWIHWLISTPGREGDSGLNLPFRVPGVEPYPPASPSPQRLLTDHERRELANPSYSIPTFEPWIPSRKFPPTRTWDPTETTSTHPRAYFPREVSTRPPLFPVGRETSGLEYVSHYNPHFIMAAGWPLLF